MIAAVAIEEATEADAAVADAGVAEAGATTAARRRDLPPSKYASSSPSRRAIYAASLRTIRRRRKTSPADFEPIILPGESLAKYKDRVPGCASAPAPARRIRACVRSGVLPQQSKLRMREMAKCRSRYPELPTSLYARRGDTAGTVKRERSAARFVPAHREPIEVDAASTSDEEAATPRMLAHEATTRTRR